MALFPRPVRAVRDRAFAAPVRIAGLGALTAFMSGVVALILAATIIGLVIVDPGAGRVAVLRRLRLCGRRVRAGRPAAAAGSGPDQKNRFLAAFTGVVVLALVGLIPVVGGLATMAVWLTGLGAVALAIVDWRRRRQAGQGAAKPPTAAAG